MRNDFLIYNKHDNNQWIEHLTFFSKKSLYFLKQYFKLLLINSIYKINKFDLSLINFVSISALDWTFYIDDCFMKKNESSFIWMLWWLKMIYLKITSLYHSTTMIIDADNVLISVLSTVFPHMNHLLCIWHVQKNVLAYIKNKIYTETMKKSLK